MSTLFVPIKVQALVVNDEARKAQNFQRWKMNYNNLDAYASPMPAAFDSSTASNWNNEPDANGVYLHWTLPHALRTGAQQNTQGTVDYPLVPNRWLVIRYAGPPAQRTATAWVVESDFLDPNDGTSAYIDPSSTDNLAVTCIGKKVDLDSWKEGDTSNMFLTAIGAGDITFSAYQPYNENVFSIHDKLSGVAHKDTLSYMVAGWYSDPSKDMLASATDQDSFSQLLQQYNWQVENKESSPFCKTSVYQGFVFDIAWDEEGPVPASDKPASATLAVGNTSIDALTELIRQQAGNDKSINPDLLEAFQYNLLPLLDQPNGPELLYRAIHKAWFGSLKGGYEWVIVKDPSDASGTDSHMPAPQSPTDWVDPNLTPAWLAVLNQNQKELDGDLQALKAEAWNLYRMWFTKGVFDNLPNQQPLTKKDGDFSNFEEQLAKLASNLDPKQQGTTASKILGLLQLIPHGDTQAALQKSITTYTKKNKLPEGYTLKRYSGDPYHTANDPVVLIAGSGASEPLFNGDALLCRVANQLVTGLNFQTKAINAETMKGQIPLPNDLQEVPIVPPALIQEFFFLDPSNATMMADIALGDGSQTAALQAQITAREGMLGTLPVLLPTAWKQPWAPMFLLWKVKYYPIAHGENGTDNWRFDGQQYVLSDKDLPQKDPKPFTLSGTTLLTPQSRFNFKKRLEKYRQKHPSLDKTELAALDNFITETDSWDFLSQKLDGLTHQLTCRGHESNRIPGPKEFIHSLNISTLIGDQNTIVPQVGALPQPFKGWPISNFQQFRSGQFCFERLMLVDQFGQSLELINSSNYLQQSPVIAPDMVPKKTVLDQEPKRFIQLSPRILQPARLNFDFVSAQDDTKPINLHSDVNPVCAWVLPNHLDKALACYDPAGAYLGELRVITNDQGQRAVHWDGAPESDYADLDAVLEAFPHLGQMLQALVKQGPQAFASFYQVIDETLWVVDPLGNRDDQNLSVLVGRPLALTRGRLNYELESPPVTDPSWQYTFQEATPEFTKYTFPVRLGELKLRNDGLIGYFLEHNYNQFNCVHTPPGGGAPPYNVQIGEGNFVDLTFAPNDEAYLTMLVDPRAAVHATTAILPAPTLELPARYTEPALNAMNVTFRVAPILSTNTTKASQQPTAGNTTSVVMPKPAEKKGTWSWVEQSATATWTTAPIKPTDDKAHLSNVRSRLRSGMLKLSKALKDGQ